MKNFIKSKRINKYKNILKPKFVHIIYENCELLSLDYNKCSIYYDNKRKNIICIEFDINNNKFDNSAMFGQYEHSDENIAYNTDKKSVIKRKDITQIHFVDKNMNTLFSYCPRYIEKACFCCTSPNILQENTFIEETGIMIYSFINDKNIEYYYDSKNNSMYITLPKKYEYLSKELEGYEKITVI